MTLHRRAVLASFVAALAGCGRSAPPEQSETPRPTPDTGPDTADTTGTDPAYASCDPDLATTETLHTAGGIPEPLGEPEAASYARELEQDLVLPPPEDRSDGYVSTGTVETETVEYGYLATVPVTGGYYNRDGEGTVTVHADLGNHIATYFLNSRVVRRAEDTTAELDPREYGEVVVCESG